MAPSPLRKSPVSKIWGSRASTVGSKRYIRKALLAAGPCKQAAAFLRTAKKMKSLLTFTVLFAWGLSPAHGSLWELHKMITKTTGKNALLHYSSYGCYCGLGGRGQPKDATDRCCQLHDNCYNSLQSYRCNAKMQSYHYSWHSGRPSCREGSWCAQLSCECDRSLALCLKRSIGTYSKRYCFYPKLWCW